MKGYPGADCGSDHVNIVATMKVRQRDEEEEMKMHIYLLRTNNEDRKKIQSGNLGTHQ